MYDLPKSIDGLMRYMRVKKHISISGSAQKRKLRNMGYYHGYKGYRFIGKSSNSILYTDFKELVAIYDFDMRLKSLLYPQLMFIETALKNYVLEEILKESNSDNFNYIYTKLLTDYTRFTPGSDKQKNAIKQRLAVRDRVYSALTREYGNKKEVVQHFYHKDTSVPIDFFPAALALALQLLEVRHRDGKKLHDDRGRDVRHDSQCEDRRIGECTTGEHVQKRHQAACGLRLKSAELIGIDTRQDNK